jgi:CBS domain-containing protein
LPVVDDAGRVQGLVARTDILRAVLDDTTVDQWG